MRAKYLLPMLWVLLSCASTGGPRGGDSQQAETALELSSIEPACTLKKSWVGLAFQLPEGVWLRCGGRPVLVVHPLNLFHRVHIDTEEKALEFLRLFSAGDAHLLFPELGGLKEVTADLAEEWGLVGETDFIPKPALDPPEIDTSSEQTVCFDEDGAQATCSIRTYRIRRSVVLYDNRIHRASETLREDGFYSIDLGDPMTGNLEALGILHLPPY